MAEPELSPGSPNGELQSDQGINRDSVRVDQRTHVADDEAGLASLEQRPGPRAELRDGGPSNQTANDEDDCVGFVKRSERAHQCFGQLSDSGHSQVLLSLCSLKTRPLSGLKLIVLWGRRQGGQDITADKFRNPAQSNQLIWVEQSEKLTSREVRLTIADEVPGSAREEGIKVRKIGAGSFMSLVSTGGRIQ